MILNLMTTLKLFLLLVLLLVLIVELNYTYRLIQGFNTLNRFKRRRRKKANNSACKK